MKVIVASFLIIVLTACSSGSKDLYVLFTNSKYLGNKSSVVASIDGVVFLADSIISIKITPAFIESKVQVLGGKHLLKIEFGEATYLDSIELLENKVILVSLIENKDSVDEIRWKEIPFGLSLD